MNIIKSIEFINDSNNELKFSDKNNDGIPWAMTGLDNMLQSFLKIVFRSYGQEKDELYHPLMDRISIDEGEKASHLEAPIILNSKYSKLLVYIDITKNNDGKEIVKYSIVNDIAIREHFRMDMR